MHLRDFHSFPHVCLKYALLSVSTMIKNTLRRDPHDDTSRSRRRDKDDTKAGLKESEPLSEHAGLDSRSLRQHTSCANAILRARERK